MVCTDINLPGNLKKSKQFSVYDYFIDAITQGNKVEPRTSLKSSRGNKNI